MVRIRKYVKKNGRIPFDEWIASLKDNQVKARLLKRLDKVILGNPGDCRSVGDGVFEMREHFRQGFRIYYGMEERDVILLLCGGDKVSQSKDIKRAKEYWKDYIEGS